eukprot:1623092-Ditylum_brightwellii.AAC.1
MAKSCPSLICSNRSSIGAARLNGCAILSSDSVIIVEMIWPLENGVGVSNIDPVVLEDRVVVRMRTGLVDLGLGALVVQRCGQQLVGNALVLVNVVNGLVGRFTGYFRHSRMREIMEDFLYCRCLPCRADGELSDSGAVPKASCAC